MKVSSSQRMIILDVLRGIAILLVILVHSPTAIPAQTGIFEAVFGYFNTVGWIGVDLFFVLSGFLISSLLFNELERTRTIRCWRFWGRRGFKIWPSYFAAYGTMLLLWLMRDLWLGNSEAVKESLWDAIWNSLFIQNYVNCERWPHSWTLAVEEHFYIILPLVLCLLFYSNFRTFRHSKNFYTSLICGIVVVNGIILVGRFLNYENVNSWKEINVVSHFRFDSLLVGVAASAVTRFYTPSKRTNQILAVLAMALVYSSFSLAYLRPIRITWHCSTYGYTLFAIAFGLTIYLSVINQESSFVRSVTRSKLGTSLSWIGIYSYTIYLSHSVFFAVPGMERTRQMILAHLQSSSLPDFFINWTDRLFFCLVSILGGVILSHIIERPFLRLRSRVLPSTSSVQLISKNPNEVAERIPAQFDVEVS